MNIRWPCSEAVNGMILTCNPTDRPQAHRVYSVVRNLGIAFWVTVVAMIACAVVLPLYFVDALALLAVAIGLIRPYRSDKPFSAGRKIFAGVMGVFAVIEIGIFYYWSGCFGIIPNASFALAVGEADRVVIRDGGFCHGDPDREPVLYVLTNNAEIAAFNQMFRFTGSRPPCCCCGYPGVDWWKGDRRIVKSAIHHGVALRCTGFPSDLGLALSSRALLRDWFKRHCDIDLREASGRRYQSCASAREHLERCAEMRMKSHVGNRPSLEDVRKFVTDQGKTIYDCPSGGKYTLSFDDKGAPCVKCSTPGHEWSFETGWDEK